MMTSRDEISLQRHLISAGQWLKKREQGWTSGIAYSKALKIEQSLYASLSVLSDYADEFLLPQWPTKPFQQKIALIALLQSTNTEVFRSGVKKYIELLEEDAPFYAGALWLAQPLDLTTAQQNVVIESGVLNTLTSQQWCQCVWPEKTMKALILASDLSAPAWLQENAQITHCKKQQLLREFMLKGNASARDIQLYLQSSKTNEYSWQLLALLDQPESLNLFFEYCERAPENLRFAVLNGSTQMLDLLLPLLAKPQFAQAAANVIEQILATPIEWKPSLFDANTGKLIEEGPKLPIAPDLDDTNDSILLMGQVRNLDVYIAWLLNQPTDIQHLGWLNLGMQMSSAIPDLSSHWTHVQLKYLQATICQKAQVLHAA
jgi:hypothetical protein